MKWEKLKRRSLNLTFTLILILCGTCVKRRIPNQSLHTVHFSWRPTLGDEAVAKWKTGCMQVHVGIEMITLLHPVPLLNKYQGVYKSCLVFQPTPDQHMSSTTPRLIQKNQLQQAMAGPEPELRGFARMVGGGARPLDRGWTGLELLNQWVTFWENWSTWCPVKTWNAWVQRLIYTHVFHYCMWNIMTYWCILHSERGTCMSSSFAQI